MRSLSEFEVPTDGEITLCEVDGRVHSMNYECHNVKAFTSTIEKHPHISISRDMLHPKSGDESKALFLSVDVPFLKQLIKIYYEHGFLDMLQTVASQRHYVLSRSALLLLKLVETAHKLRLLVNPHFEEGTANIITKVSQTRNWPFSPIRCINWHPYSTKIAVAAFDDSVRIYCSDLNLTPSLKCKQQRNITCLAWRPMSNSELAVGCENGIIIWSVDPSSVVTRPSSNSATVLYRLEHRPVASISWGPLGDVLVSAAVCDSQILVWDVEMNRTSSLKRSGGSGNTIVKWSPTGNKMFSSTTGVVFRVWECKTWQAERWNILSGRIQAACWSPCGSMLLFATNEEPLIYGLSFLDSDLIFAIHANNTPNQAIPLFDLTKVDINGPIAGGLVQNMVMDPKGKHLAVLFQDTNYIAIFNVIMQPVLQIGASCLVAGLPEETPTAVAFQGNFDDGACLSIGWSSGRLQHFPIVYTDLGGLNIKTAKVQSSTYSPFGSLSSPHLYSY